MKFRNELDRERALLEASRERVEAHEAWLDAPPEEKDLKKRNYDGAVRRWHEISSAGVEESD